mmetsp:Transcript_30536/g.57807  ORF Transcript_30536/g.57807 Transcript_30536/m.57807 type:complete len:87 (+) Transcript_30536:2033-2293(+)
MGGGLVATKQEFKPPFWLNHINVAKVNGTFVVTEKKPSKKLTKPVNVHVPLMCEEMNKMIILLAIFPAIYRAKHAVLSTIVCNEVF